MIKVKALHCRPSLIPVEDRLDIYMHCEPKVATRCVNTRYMKKVAQTTDRAVRKVNTLNGWANWSECVDGVWHMFRAPLTPDYCAKINTYDRTGKKFQLPLTVAKAFGKVEHKGECVERRDPAGVTAERKQRLNTRIATGKLVPRSKFRAPQVSPLLDW